MAEQSRTDAAASTLSAEELKLLDAWWRAANYLSVGQIYLLDNPLLEQPLRHEHIKPRLLGHWGTTPGLNFIYAHLNRVIKARDLDMIYICGPGHGGPGMVANTWLEGTYSEIYPNIAQNKARHAASVLASSAFRAEFRAMPRPRRRARSMRAANSAIRSSHAYGAALDNPDLIVACVIGDGEAETGPLGDLLARQQISQPRDRRRGPADPASERLQDRQPDDPRPHSTPRARGSARRLWL